jgi:multimeric flavodoxin WrbA
MEDSMKILGFCGTQKRGNTKSASEWFLKESLKAAEEMGAETEIVRLINYRIEPCTACNKCLCGMKCPLLENPKDGAKEIFDKMCEADGFIFSSPVYAYQQPAVVMNFLHRTRPLHEQERSEIWGTTVTAYHTNPFRGKPIGNLSVGAALGMEGALYYLFHYLKAMGATSVACAGIALLDAEMKNICMVNGKFAIDHPGFKSLLDRPMPGYEENQAAIEMARAVGKAVVNAAKSEVFQTISEVLKY